MTQKIMIISEKQESYNLTLIRLKTTLLFFAVFHVQSILSLEEFLWKKKAA